MASQDKKYMVVINNNSFDAHIINKQSDIYNQLQTLVDGYYEQVIGYSEIYSFFVNEEGQIRNMQENETGSKVLQSFGLLDLPIHGPVVITAYEDDDDDDEDDYNLCLTLEQVQTLHTIFDQTK